MIRAAWAGVKDDRSNGWLPMTTDEGSVAISWVIKRVFRMSSERTPKRGMVYWKKFWYRPGGWITGVGGVGGVGLGVGSGVGLGVRVGLGVGLWVGLAVGFEVGLDVPFLPLSFLP